MAVAPAERVVTNKSPICPYSIYIYIYICAKPKKGGGSILYRRRPVVKLNSHAHMAFSRIDAIRTRIEFISEFNIFVVMYCITTCCMVSIFIL